MVASLRRVVVSFWAAVFLAGPAAGQRPTFSLIPTNVEFHRRCVGGPEAGQTCTSTADCEQDDGGALYPSCERRCEGGSEDGQPCEHAGDCGGAGACTQICFCNRWVTNPPLVLGLDIIASNWSPEGQRLQAYDVEIDLGAACDAVSFFASGKSQQCPGICPDWVFCDYNALTKCSISECMAHFSAVVLGDGPVYSEPKHAALLTLDPQPFPAGCGTVTVAMSSPTKSNLIDEYHESITPLDLENLTIVFPTACSCAQIVDSTTPRCTIDPRQASEPDGSSPVGWTTVELNMNCPRVSLQPADFSIREVPGTVSYHPANVQNNVPESGWVTLTFPPTTPGVWTCIRFGAHAASEWCLGTLPGDIDASGLPEAADLLTLVDCLKASPAEACDLRVCDIDRSGACGPSDLLRAVDLLSGAEGYSPGWGGAFLPICPNP